jgi:photosystem II oxygen-evolving enhancer protein 2
MVSLPPIAASFRPCPSAPQPSSLASRLARAALALLLGVGLMGGLGACSAAAAGLQSFQSPDGRYAFLYPTGWNRAQVSDQ